MPVYAGIDCGGSCTKLCLLREDREPEYILLGSGDDPRRFLPQEELTLALTGIRAEEWDWSAFPHRRLTEYEATALGARRLSGRENILVVNCGTGTTFLHAQPDMTVHLGGSGIGGGMLPGLAQALIGSADTGELQRLAEGGSLSAIDLNISDFSNTDRLALGAEVTVANFGKLGPQSRPEDKALGLLNALYQTVGIMAVFAARSCGAAEIVVTGGSAVLSRAQELLDKVGDLCGFDFFIPEKAAFCTALGAAVIARNETKGDGHGK